MRNELFKLVTHLHVPAEAIEALVEVKRYWSGAQWIGSYA